MEVEVALPFVFPWQRDSRRGVERDYLEYRILIKYSSSIFNTPANLRTLAATSMPFWVRPRFDPCHDTSNTPPQSGIAHTTRSLVHDCAVSHPSFANPQAFAIPTVETPSHSTTRQHGLRQLRRHLRQNASPTMCSRRTTLADNRHTLHPAELLPTID